MSCLPSAPPQPHTPYTVHTRSLSSHPSPSLLGPSTQRIHALSSKNSSVLSHATGDHIVFQHQMTDQQPLRSDIYIRHAPSVTSREPALPSSPRPALVPASLLPRRPAGPTGRRAPSGGSDVRPPALFSHPLRLGPGALGCLPNFCPAQPRSGGRLKPVHLFSNNGVQWGERNI